MPKNNEFCVIENFFKPLSSDGLNDDTTSFCLENNEELVVSKDLIVEDVHFFRKDGAAKIAAKLLLSNLSDIAASGARPTHYMLGFCKNDFVDDEFIAEFCDSLCEIQQKFGVTLIGGDTVKTSDKLFFSVTIFGVIEKNKKLKRENAQDGDLIFVSGSIGDAHLGFLLNSGKFNGEISHKDREFYLERYFRPAPQIKLGEKLVEENISNCAIDVSDGFLADLNHVCRASGKDAIIYKDLLPLTEFAHKNLDFIDLLSGGEDYELIFSAKKSDEGKILELAKELEINLTCVGHFVNAKDDAKITILDNDNNEIKFTKYGYEH